MFKRGKMTLATPAMKLIADWQGVPAMADVVKQAKEMLGAAEGK